MREVRLAEPMDAVFELLGRRWTLQILWALRGDAARLTFRELREASGAPSPTTLSARLSELREAGIVEHRAGAGFGLSPAGQELVPVLLLLEGWAERHPLPTPPAGAQPSSG